MGIQPGITTLEELVLIIAQHEWVAERFRSDYTTLASHVDERGDSLNPILRWEWATTRPIWIDAQQAGVVWIPANQVTVVLIESNIALGDFILTFGEPQYVMLESVYDNPVIGLSGHEYEYTGLYMAKNLIIRTGGTCADSPMYHWPVRLFFQEIPVPDDADNHPDVCR
jgi:hypothetical protein